ncbi:MAG: ATP-binding cassette domain-containing protein, partial [Pseudomonadota bacterium]|nr:ATP-binding cassette domain-containing protein [Pseudomonadota bacterium]
MNSVADGLSVDKVHVWRGDRHVLKGLSLALRPRELLQVSGPNGSGKTTLLRVSCGLLRPEQGAVSWLGRSITAERTEYQAAMAYAS